MKIEAQKQQRQIDVHCFDIVETESVQYVHNWTVEDNQSVKETFDSDTKLRHRP